MKKRKALKNRTREVYVIAGPNGAGKTTFAREFLPHYARCLEFVNADYIASGLSPLAPELAAIDAGRVMLKRMQELITGGKSFGFETTLAGKSYTKLFRDLKQQGYRIHLYFLWLPDSTVAIERVAQRVRKGGHGISDETVIRRYNIGLRNFFETYRQLADRWILWDASLNPPSRIAGALDGRLRIENKMLSDAIISLRFKS